MATQAIEPTDLAAQADAPNDNVEPQSQPRDYEAEARVAGWKPREEYDGPPEKWSGAEEFMRRREDHLGLSNAENKRLLRRISILEGQVKKVVRSERNAFDNALAELKRQQLEAVQSGDTAAFQRVDQKIDTLKQEVADAGPAHGEDPQAEFLAFREAAPWYDLGGLPGASQAEKDARRYSDLLADKYAAQGLQNEVIPSAFFARIAEETEARYPGVKVGAAPRPKPVSDVAGVSRPGAMNGKAKTGANLPADAKAQATRFFNQGIIRAKTVAEAHEIYAKSYDWS